MTDLHNLKVLVEYMRELSEARNRRRDRRRTERRQQDAGLGAVDGIDRRHRFRRSGRDRRNTP